MNHRQMKKLMIECPLTREYVFTGIVMDEAQFERTELRNNMVGCPHCGQRHTWNKPDVTLVDDGQAPTTN